MPALLVSTPTDFRNRTLTFITDIAVVGAGATATFDASQFGFNQISHAVRLWSSGAAGEQVTVVMSASGTFSAGQWDVTSWQAGSAPFRFQGSAGNDRITGTAKADLIIGGNGSDDLRGGGGADTFRYELSSHLGLDESINGGSGTDTIEVTHGGTFNAINVDITSIETFRFTGFIGKVVFSADQVDPGAIRRIEAAAPSGALTVEVHGSTVDLSGIALIGFAGGDKTSLIGTGAADTLIGTAFHDELRGGAGADHLIGGAGFDRFVYTAPGDMVAGEVLDGGADEDRLVLDGPGLYRVDLLSLSSVERIEFDRFSSGVEVQVLSSQIGAAAPEGRRITTVDFAHLQTDTLIISGPDTDLTLVSFFGFAEREGDVIRLLGTSGADTLIGSVTGEIFVGDGGADSYRGGSSPSADTLSYATSKPVTVNLATGLGSGGFAAGDTFVEIENIIGSGGADTLTGDARDNVIEGGAGADTMTGGGGIDTLSYAGSASQVLINLGNGQAQGGDAQGDVFAGFQVLVGSDHDDALFGDGLENTINGGRGADSLFGGVNNDTFVFRRGEVDGDILLDFAGNGAAAGDQIRFEGFGPGFNLVQIDALHWEIRSAFETETFSVANAAAIHASDFFLAA